MTALPLRGLLKRRYLQSRDLLLAVVLVTEEAARLRAAGDAKQAALLDDSICSLRRRIEVEYLRFDAAQRAKRGKSSDKWFAFVAEEIAGRPEYSDWFAGRVPVLTDRFLRITKHVVTQFNEWVAKRKKDIVK